MLCITFSDVILSSNVNCHWIWRCCLTFLNVYNLLKKCTESNLHFITCWQTCGSRRGSWRTSWTWSWCPSVSFAPVIAALGTAVEETGVMPLYLIEGIVMFSKSQYKDYGGKNNTVLFFLCSIVRIQHLCSPTPLRTECLRPCQWRLSSCLRK